MQLKSVLRLPPEDLKRYQLRYGYSAEAELSHFREAAKRQGYLTSAQLLEICLWKSKRRPGLVASNSEELVKEITSFSFSAAQEESRIGVLTLLAGVRFPTASVILHFCVDADYPILDYRALWSLGLPESPQYTFEFWKEYVALCRKIASDFQLTVRELDMALWQYSREQQPPKRAASRSNTTNNPI